MGTGYERTDTDNNIANGNVIDADDLDSEFNAIEAAFNESTGHTHDGTADEGAPITVLGPTQDVVATASVLRPKTNNVVSLGEGSTPYKFKDLHLSGNANVATNATIGGTLGVTGAATLSNNLSVTGTTTLTDTFTANGNTVLGSDNADTVTVNADIASNLLPSAGGTYDIGSATAAEKWQNIYIDGTANLPTISSTTATIGTLSVSSSLTVPDNSIALGTKTTGNYVAAVSAGNAIDIGGTAGEGWTATVNLDLSELTTSTTDGDGDYFVVVDSSNAQKKLTKANINLSGFNNDLTLTSGTVTSVEGGAYLTGGTITSSGTLAVDATSANTASKVVARDASGNFSAGTITATLSGTASSVSNTLTRGTYLTGSNFDGSAATTWAVDATSANTANKVVVRDASGDFSVGTISGNLQGDTTGTHTGAVNATDITVTGVVTGNVTGDILGDVKAQNGTVILDSGTNGTDATYTGNVDGVKYTETYTTISSSSGTATLDCDAGTIFSLTLSENISTFTWSNPPASGTAYGFTLKVIQDASASTYTIQWPSSVDWANRTAPVLSTGASHVDHLVFYTHDGGTTWYGFVAGKDFG